MTMAPLAARRLNEMVDLGRRWSRSSWWWPPGRSTSRGGRLGAGTGPLTGWFAIASPTPAGEPCRPTSSAHHLGDRPTDRRPAPQRRSSTRYVQPCSTSPQKKVTMHRDRRNSTNCAKGAARSRTTLSTSSSSVISAGGSSCGAARSSASRSPCWERSSPHAEAPTRAPAASAGPGGAQGRSHAAIAGVVPTGAIDPPRSTTRAG